jgi:hypothetical protein
MALSRFSSRKNNNTYLYTKGREFSLFGQNYIGEYHYDGSTPKTGPIPSDSSQKLTRFYNIKDHYTYDKTFNFNTKVLTFTNPIPYLYRPKDTVYLSGYDSRYFVEKVDDENSYAIEIDQIQYQGMGKQGGIDNGLYLAVTLNWKFTGRREDIIKHNEQELQKASVKLPTVAYAVKSTLEFARITLV